MSVQLRRASPSRTPCGFGFFVFLGSPTWRRNSEERRLAHRSRVCAWHDSSGIRYIFSEKGDYGMPTKKTNAAFLKMAQAPLKPSPQLAEVLGSASPISRPQVAKKVWAYIKKHKLQDPNKRREIIADGKLKPVFGKPRLDMFQMTSAISKHLSKE
jgi:hypothetical protein